MTAAKQKGTRFETDIVEYLQTHGFPYAERRAQTGQHDRGDITGIVGWAIEAKACKTIDLAAWVGEAQREAGAAGAKWWAVIAKRRMRGTGDAYVVMTLEQFCRLVGEEL